RRVIHVLGGSLYETVVLSDNRVLDGEDTALMSPGTPITITAPADVVVEGFRLAAPDNMKPAIDVTGDQAKATLYGLTVNGPGGPLITGGFATEIALRKSHVGSLTSGSSNQVSCQNGKLIADQNTFENAFIRPISGTC